MVRFMHQIPKIKKNQLGHVHDLTKYVILSNPIEIANAPKTKIRRKSNTIAHPNHH